jgi:hypothetical protein
VKVLSEMNEADGRVLFEFSRSFVPPRGVAAVNDVALALVGQPPDNVDQGIETMLKLFADNLAAQPDPPSEIFIRGIIVVCKEMLRERLVELQAHRSGQS